MAKKSDLQRAIDSLAEEIDILTRARDRLLATQIAKPKSTRKAKPRPVEKTA